jgi:hypothetical protein
MSDTPTIDNNARFIELLKSTKRPGVDAVIEGLDNIGFFNAPASSKHHLAYEGGLVAHSLNVYAQASLLREVQVGLRPDIAERVPEDSVVIVSLLHDICKADIYKQVEKFRKDKDNKWEKYLAYETDYTHCPLGHGEKSVIRLLRMGLELTDDEIAAIRWHMAGWDLVDSYEAKGNFNAACDKYPLLPIIIAADELATRILEVP